jgi:cytochrome c553
MHPMARHLKSVMDLESVASYVASLKPRKPEPTKGFGGDPAKGKADFATCSACHGADAAGKVEMNSPSLRNSNDWYLLSQLKKFDKKVRGYTTADTGGSIMIQQVKVLNSDEQKMRDVIAYIMSLK